jgi:hypothetical protein
MTSKKASFEPVLEKSGKELHACKNKRTVE